MSEDSRAFEMINRVRKHNGLKPLGLKKGGSVDENCEDLKKPPEFWPCEHIARIRVQQRFKYFHAKDRVTPIPHNWDICPVKGCGARRPEEKETKDLYKHIHDIMKTVRRAQNENRFNITLNCEMIDRVYWDVMEAKQNIEGELLDLKVAISEIQTHSKGCFQSGHGAALSQLDRIDQIVSHLEK